MKKQKIFTLVLLALTLCGLVACKEEEKTDKINVAIVQIFENSAFADMRNGFIDHMRDMGYDESKMVFHLKDAQGDAGVLNTIAQEVTSGNYDFAVAIATPPVQALVNMETDLPIFYMGVFDPLIARIMTNRENPDKNATGASHEVPHEKIFDLAKELTPNVKSYGLLYCPNELNAVAVITAVKEYFAQENIPYKEAIVTNASEAQQAAQSLAESVDALFVPVDAVLQSVMPTIAEVALDANLPLYGSSVTNIMSGAFATLATEDTQLGKVAAQMAIDHLNGTPINQIPAARVGATLTVVNEKVANALGIALPEDKGFILVNP